MITTLTKLINLFFPDRKTHYYHFIFAGLFYSLVGGVLLFSYWWKVPIQNSHSSSYDMIQNIYQDGTHKTYNSEYGFWSYATRMPFVPYFCAAMGRIFPTNKWFGALLKNIIFTPIIFFSIYLILPNLRRRRILIAGISLVLVFSPLFLIQTVGMDVEEPFIIPVLSILSVLLFFPSVILGWQKRHKGILIISGLITALFFIKSSLLYLCLILPVLFLFKIKDLFLFKICYLALFSGILCWGIFNFLGSGNFRITSSINGLNFYKGNNLEAYTHYPLDLDFIRLEKPVGKFKNEWELDHKYSEMGLKFASTHPSKFFELILRKSFVFFIDFSPAPYRIKHIYYKYKALIAFNAFLRLVFIFALLQSLINIIIKKYLTDSIIYLLLVLFFAAPFIIGFAYARHYLPLILPSLFYLTRVNAFEWSRNISFVWLRPKKF